MEELLRVGPDHAGRGGAGLLCQGKVMVHTTVMKPLYSKDFALLGNWPFYSSLMETDDGGSMNNRGTRRGLNRQVF